MENELILTEIEKIMRQRRLTRYKLSQMSEIKQSTLTTILNKRSVISISNLEKISRAFGMKLSEFISRLEEKSEDTGETDFPVCEWKCLSPEERQVMIYLMQKLNRTGEDADIT